MLCSCSGSSWGKTGAILYLAKVWYLRFYFLICHFNNRMFPFFPFSRNGSFLNTRSSHSSAHTEVFCYCWFPCTACLGFFPLLGLFLFLRICALHHRFDRIVGNFLCSNIAVSKARILQLLVVALFKMSALGLKETILERGWWRLETWELGLHTYMFLCFYFEVETVM